MLLLIERVGLNKILVYWLIYNEKPFHANYLITIGSVSELTKKNSGVLIIIWNIIVWMGPDLLYVSEGKIAGSICSSIKEICLHFNRSFIVFYEEAVNMHWIDSGNFDIFNTTFEIWSQVIESVSDTIVYLRIGFIAWFDILSWKEKKSYQNNFLHQWPPSLFGKTMWL